MNPHRLSVLSVVVVGFPLALVADRSAAQGPAIQSLGNLNPGPMRPGSQARDFVELNGELLFTANSASSLRDLWKTDGTPAGTVQLIYGGSGAASVGITARVGGVVVFERFDELWATDGTVAGITKISDVDPIAFPADWDGARRRPFGAPGMVFAGRDAAGGIEPWITNGTAAGTMRLVDLVPGSAGSGVADLQAIEWSDGTTTRDLTFFTADDGVSGRELWVTEGTAATTRRVVDLEPGAGSGVADTELVAWVRPTAADLYVAFRGAPAATGTELFRLRRRWTDFAFTLMNTSEIAPGPADADPRDLVMLGSDVVCAAENALRGRELWSVRITTGAQVLVDVEAGSGSSNPGDLLSVSGLAQQTRAAVYFSATTAAAGRELHLWDGVGLRLLADLAPGPASSSPTPLAAMAGALWLAADDGLTGRELWVSDGINVAPGHDLNAGPGSSNPRDALVFDPGGGPLMVLAADAAGTVGEEPHAIAPSGPAVPLDVSRYHGRSSSPWMLCRLADGRIVFRAHSPATGTELWVTDGSGVSVIETQPGSSADAIGSFALGLDDGTFVYTVQKTVPALIPPFITTYSQELWRSDASGTRTLLGTLHNSSSALSPQSFVEWQGDIYFTWIDDSGRREIWRAMRSGGVARVTPFEAYDPTPAGDRMFFVGTQGGDTELYVLRPGGAINVIDINPTGSSRPNNLVTFRNRCFFSADDGVTGRELWSSTGTVNGTAQVVDVHPGPASGLQFGAELIDAGSGLFFAASDGVAGEELWLSNGFSARLVADLQPGSAGSFPREITAVHVDRVACTAQTANGGRELWLIDVLGGTTGFDLQPGPGSSDPRSLTWTTRYLLFTADDGVSGREPWFADWIDFSTVAQVADIAPGAQGSHPTQFSAVGDLAWFTADDQGLQGREPWAADLRSGTFAIGESCPGPDQTLAMNATAPLVGGRLTYWAFELGAPATAVAYISTVPLAPTVSGLLPCPLQVDLLTMVIVGGAAITSPGGFVQSLQIPPRTSFVGIQLRMQTLVFPGGMGPLRMTNGLVLEFGL